MYRYPMLCGPVGVLSRTARPGRLGSEGCREQIQRGGSGTGQQQQSWQRRDCRVSASTAIAPTTICTVAIAIRDPGQRTRRSRSESRAAGVQAEHGRIR